MVSAAQKTEAHVGIVEGDERLDGSCLLQESGIEEARNGKRRRIATTQSVQSNQPKVPSRTGMVRDKSRPMITTIRELT